MKSQGTWHVASTPRSASVKTFQLPIGLFPYQGVAKIALSFSESKHVLNKKRRQSCCCFLPRTIQKKISQQRIRNLPILKFFTHLFSNRSKCRSKRCVFLLPVTPRIYHFGGFSPPIVKLDWIISPGRKAKKKTSVKPPPKFSGFRFLSSHLCRSCYPKDVGWKPNFAKPFWKICHPFARCPNALVRTQKILQNVWEPREY